MNTTIVQFIAKSSNAKIGAIPATTSSRNTCPKACPLRGKGGCYAESGFYTRSNWDKVSDGLRGAEWDSLTDSISSLPANTLWRHNVAGDLPHNNEYIDTAKLAKLVRANAGKLGFTYTHHDVLNNAANYANVRIANRLGFTVNLSANNLAHADQLKAKGGAPVVSVVPADQLTNTTTPDGHKVVICPAVTRDDVTCKSCGLCARSDRKAIIGFPAHGSRKNAINFN
jgi:hypothetical protein